MKFPNNFPTASPATPESQSQPGLLHTVWQVSGAPALGLGSILLPTRGQLSGPSLTVGVGWRKSLGWRVCWVRMYNLEELYKHVGARGPGLHAAPSSHFTCLSASRPATDQDAIEHQEATEHCKAEWLVRTQLGHPLRVPTQVS